MRTGKFVAIGIAGSVFGLGAGLTAPLAWAQVTAPGFASKPMIVAPVTGADDKEVVLINVAIEPGASSPRHTHPGDCIGAIVDGTVELVVDGKEPQRFSAGQAWHNPRGPAHYFKNVGTVPVRMTNVLLVDKGKPRTVVEKPAEGK